MTAEEKLFTEYFTALELYDRYDRGARESMQEELNLATSKDQALARKVGKFKWTNRQTAKGIRDDQQFAERKVALHGMVSLVAALRNLDVQVQKLAEELRALTSQLQERDRLP